MSPGGALDVIADGELDGIERAFAIHCDPKIEVGQVGFQAGPITAGADRIRVSLTGPGGHTARPHLTADLVYALGAVVTELPALLSRRADPRSGLSLVWGQVHAGAAANAIPQTGFAEGTVRCLDADTWEAAHELVPELAQALVAPYGVDADVDVHVSRAAMRQRRSGDRADPQRRARRARPGRRSRPPTRASVARTSRGFSTGFRVLWSGLGSAARMLPTAATCTREHLT